jgi:pimeloyl-ACP methyl ester carboxylesterase
MAAQVGDDGHPPRLGRPGVLRSPRPGRPPASLPAHAALLAALAAVAVLAACSGAVDPVDEEVAIPADGLDLEGTLRLPGGDPPFSAVAIVPGPGSPTSRDGVASGQFLLDLPAAVPVLAELAEGLREAGYAVLTWDQRDCGTFNDCADNAYPPPPDELTVDTVAADVDAALDHLAARGDIDGLVLAGHSEGGGIAARLAAERADLGTVVLLGTPGVPLVEVLDAQADAMATQLGLDGSDDDHPAVAQLRQQHDEVRAIADGELDGPPVGGISRAMLASRIESVDTAPDRLRRSGLPTLALGFEHDTQVPPEQVRAWEPTLPDGSRLEILPELTHVLTRLVLAPDGIMPEEIGTEVDASVIRTIADWLDTTLDR